MRKLITLIFLLLAVSMQAQEQKKEKFSPEKFEEELKTYVIKEACLSQQEANAFTPVYKEMRDQQRKLFERQRKLGKEKPKDDAECKKTIRERDAIELEQKRVLQTYHERFLEILPASKVYDLIKAEDRFHRHMMRNWSQGQRSPRR